MKNGRVTGIVAIEITCECGQLCEAANGSQFVTKEDKKVKCPGCGNEYLVPARAFEVKVSRRSSLRDLNRRLLAEMHNQ